MADVASVSQRTPPPAPVAKPLEIDSIVAELRTIREDSLAQRRRLARPAKLPSQKSLRTVLEHLTAAFFPNRLGARTPAGAGVDFFVGHQLDLALRELDAQLRLEIRFAADSATNDDAPRATADLADFAARLPHVRRLLESDLRAAYAVDPAAGTIDEVLVCYPGITAVIHYRIAHVLYRLGYPLVARMITELAHSQTGIDIHPGAEIGESFFIDHGTGVVIGETAILGRRVRMDYGVTLGGQRATSADAAAPTGRSRHPIVEDDVVIYAGATLLGPITIGQGSTIGGNVWLTTSVPPGSHIAQAEVRREEYDSGSGI